MYIILVQGKVLAPVLSIITSCVNIYRVQECHIPGGKDYTLLAMFFKLIDDRSHISFG